MAGPSLPSRLLVAVCDSTPAEVVGSELHLNPIAGQDPDVVHPHLAGDVREHLVSVLELDPEHGVGQRLHHRSLDQDRVVFGLGDNRHLPHVWRARTKRANPPGVDRSGYSTPSLPSNRTIQDTPVTTRSGKQG